MLVIVSAAVLSLVSCDSREQAHINNAGEHALDSVKELSAAGEHASDRAKDSVETVWKRTFAGDIAEK